MLAAAFRTLPSSSVEQERLRPMTQAPDAASLLGNRLYNFGLARRHEVILKKEQSPSERTQTQIWAADE
jgi:hypothetical protein